MDSWVRRVLVVEDEALVRTLLADSLQSAGFAVTTARNAPEAREAVDEFDPDVAVLDIHLGGGPSGLHLGLSLHKTNPEVGLVFLSKYTDRRVGDHGPLDVPAGSAFVAKDRINDIHALTGAIESVLRGDAAPDDRSDGLLSGLTPTQLEILRLVALGFTNAAIARTRNTQERTVEQRLQAIYATLGIPVSGDVNPRVRSVLLYIRSVGVPEDSHATAPSEAQLPANDPWPDGSHHAEM